MNLQVIILKLAFFTLNAIIGPLYANKPLPPPVDCGELTANQTAHTITELDLLAYDLMRGEIAPHQITKKGNGETHQYYVIETADGIFKRVRIKVESSRLKHLPDRPPRTPDYEGYVKLVTPDKKGNRIKGVTDAYDDLGIPRVSGDRQFMPALDSDGKPLYRGHPDDPYFTGDEKPPIKKIPRDDVKAPRGYDNDDAFDINLKMLDAKVTLPVKKVRIPDLELDPHNMLTEAGEFLAIEHIKEVKKIKQQDLSAPITKLGEGSAGAVFKVCLKNASPQCRAIKVFKKIPGVIDALEMDLYLEELADIAFSSLKFVEHTDKGKNVAPIRIDGQMVNLPGKSNGDTRLVRGLKKLNPDTLSEGIMELELIDWTPHQSSEYQRMLNVHRQNPTVRKSIITRISDQIFEHFTPNDDALREYWVNEMITSGARYSKEELISIWPGYKKNPKYVNDYMLIKDKFKKHFRSSFNDMAEKYLDHFSNPKHTGPEISKIYETLNLCAKTRNIPEMAAICASYRLAFNIPDDMLNRIHALEQGYRDSTKPAILDRRANFPQPELIRGNHAEFTPPDTFVVREIGFDYNHGENVGWIASEGRFGRMDR